jgi:hypothetical protein
LRSKRSRGRATPPPRLSRAERRAKIREASDNDPRLGVESKDLPVWEGLAMRVVRYEKGSIRLSEHYGLEMPPPPPQEFYDIAMLRQTELSADHGIFVSMRILDDAGLLSLAPDELAELNKDVRMKVSPETWSEISVHLDKIEKHDLDQEAFIVALWTELVAQPLSDIWLAAKAQYAYFIENNDFAFGYLIAQLDRRQELESNFLRGKKIVESGRMGGNARANRMMSSSQRTLKAMRRLVDEGHSVARAATLAHEGGQGTSAEANRRLWNRRKQKVGT